MAFLAIFSGAPNKSLQRTRLRRAAEFKKRSAASE